MMTRVAYFLICLGLVLPSMGVLAAEDEDEDLDVIFLNDGTTVRTKVSKDDYVLVIGRRGHSTVKKESYKVKDVLRANRPPEYDIGLDRYKEGRYAVAAKYFTRSLRSKDFKDTPWVIEYCNYRLGEAMYDGGFFDGYKGKTYTYKPPAQYYAAVLKANPKSRFLLDASVKLPICLVEQKKYAEAEKAFVTAEAKIKQYREETAKTAILEYRKQAERAKAMLMLGKARLMEKKKDFAQATQIYMSVQRLARGKFPETYADGVDGELRCLVKQDRFEDAKARAKSLIDQYQKKHDQGLVSMLPGAYTVMGRASLALAGEYDKNNNPLQAQQSYADARWYYLQVLVQFFDREEYLEEANYFVGLCYDKLKADEPMGKDMAIRYWLNVQRNYPDGTFGEQAKNDLARIGYEPPAKKKADPTAAPAKKEPAKEAPGKKGPAKKGSAKKGGEQK